VEYTVKSGKKGNLNSKFDVISLEIRSLIETVEADFGNRRIEYVDEFELT
jgi:hypothetical protein